MIGPNAQTRCGDPPEKVAEREMYLSQLGLPGVGGEGGDGGDGGDGGAGGALPLTTG